jgi:2-methylisocitrate lyase-like PEP mutase family enzyme
MVEGGLTPILPLARLDELGFAVVLYANSAMRAAITGMREVMGHLLRYGDTNEITARFATWQERQDLVHKPLFDALSDKYSSDADPESETWK